MQKEENNKEKFFSEEINTDNAAINFVELLKENKTFFLNGAWGSGKTTFLTKVSQTAQQKYHTKLVTIDLWRVENSSSIITVAFRKLLPFFYWGFRLVITIFISIFILSTGVIKIPLIQKTFSSLATSGNIWVTFGLLIIIVITLFISLSKLLEIKSDALDAWFLSTIRLSKKILVIDDFDRLTPEQQKDSYKLFSLLSGHLPIIFLGEYRRILQHSDKYFLSKVIDRRVELPIVLYPSKIWTTYFKFITEKMNYTVSQKLLNLFISEQRNLRDREHFNDYVFQEFFIRNKMGHVQIEDQLLIIYIYLFHASLYHKLLNGITIEHEIDNKQKKVESPIIDLILDLQENKKEVYPPSYSVNNSGYYIFELISNSTVSELESIFDNNTALMKQIEENYSLKETDFFQYVKIEYYNLQRQQKLNLFDNAIKVYKNSGRNKFIWFLVREKSNEILSFPIFQGNGMYSIPEDLAGKTDDEAKAIRFQEWNSILDGYEFDISEKIRFFSEFQLFNYKYLSVKYNSIELLLEKSEQHLYPEEILLVHLSQKDQWIKFEHWNDLVWSTIKKLPAKSFNHFFETQNVFSIKDSEKPKHWIIIQKFDNGFDMQDNTYVIQHIQDQLKSLTKEGYSYEPRTHYSR